MNRKILTRLLSVLLAVVMTFGLLPVSASAAWRWPWSKAETQPAKTAEQAVAVDTQATTDSSEFIRIFHLDCGRKYFSVADIEKMIDLLAKNHYTHMELAFGNDGLRFLLNDMSVTVGTKTYDSTAVTSAIKNGNAAFYKEATSSTETGTAELTETDMNTIISYAAGKGIEIIPMFDAPGHMYAVIKAIEEVTGEKPTYSDPSNSGSSPNWAINPTDTNSIAFVQALIEKYIAYFAEKKCTYFNIAGDECGFSSMNDTTYAKYIALMNTLAAKVKNAGMTPLMFSDGVYYGNSNTIDTSSGSKNADALSRDIVLCYWTAGGSYAPATGLEYKGFKILNTNTYWYYVAGRDNGQENSGEWSNAYSLQWVKYHVNNSASSCLKVDGADLGTISPIGCMIAMWCDDPSNTLNWNNIAEYISLVPSKNPTYFVATPEFAITGATNLTVGATAVLTANEDVLSWTVDKNDVVSISISETSATTATVTALAKGEATITATSTSGKTATHTITVTDGSEPKNKEYITVAVGASTELTVDGVYDGSYAATPDGYATVSAKQQSGEKQLVKITTADELIDGQYVIATNRADRVLMNTAERNSNTNWSYRLKLSNVAASADTTDLWTFKKQTNGTYWVQDSNGKYLTVGSGSADVQSSSANLTIGTCAGSDYSGWDIAQNSYYLNQYGGDTADYAAGYSNTYASGDYDRGSCWNIYRITSGDATKSTLTFAGVEATPDGQPATVTIGDTIYYITVTPEDLSDAPKLPIQLWITNQAIQVNQDSVESQTLSGYSGSGAQYIYITADKAYGINGAKLSDCVPDLVENHYENDGVWWTTYKTGKTPADFKLYKGVRLTVSSDGYQNIWAENKINAGDNFQYVRYYQGKWWASIDGTTSWFEVTGNGSDKTYTSSNLKEQLIAYYYMRTELTDEVITDVVDWGDSTDKWTSGNALLDFAVRYTSGERTPSAFPVTGKTRVMSTTGNVVVDTNEAYRIVNQIDVTNTPGYEVYMITLTPTDDEVTSVSSYTYDYTKEQVTWVSSADDLPGDFKLSDRWYTDKTTAWKVESTDSTVTKAGSLTFNLTNGTNVGGDPTLPFVEIASKTGMLVTYYIRAKQTEDSLTVRYVNQTTNTEFYSYLINVNQGVTFKESIALKNPWKDTLYDGDVKNSTNKTQWVSADLSSMPQISAQYRYIDYTCVRVKRSTDGKEVTLYYTFDNEVSFVYDFGLPFRITLGDLNANLTGTNVTITKAEVVDATKIKYGKVTIGEDHSITYTPDSAAAGSETFELKITGNIPKENEDGTTTIQNGDVTYTINIVPASNVLYEENFLQQRTADAISGMNGNIRWKENTSEGLTSQAAQLTTDGTQIYGYDDAYKLAVSRNGYWEVTGLHDAQTQWDESAPLETTFTGNGFDLIGSCGPTTGRVLVAIKNAAGKMVKAALVDTYYSQTDIHQVPLAHLMLGGDDATYTVQIFAYGALKPHETASTQSAISTFAASAMTADPVTAKLRELGISWSDVEIISAAETLEASPVSGNAVAVQSMPAAMAVATDDTATDETATAGEYSVTIDGFRVYRSTSNSAYSAAEKNVTYANILDVVDGQITAFVDDPNTNETTFAVKEYEAKGGPQNEIYLAPYTEEDKLVQFQLVDADGNAYANKPVQISFRKVDGTDKEGNNCVAKYNDTAVSSIVEMYYSVTTDDQGIVTISNKVTDSDGNLTLLAIGNVKLPAGVKAVAPKNVDTQLLLKAARAVVSPEPAKETFTPDTFKANATSLRLFRNKVVTLNISVSKDVAYVTVNGKTYTPSKFLSRWLKTATILVTDTIGRNDSKTYTIIAYNSDGVASDPIEVRG